MTTDRLPPAPAASEGVAPDAGVLRSPLLSSADFEHAFFARTGGASEGAYRSLNFSFAVGDDNERVDHNLRLAARTLGVDVSHLYFLSQVHGSTTIELHGQEEQRRVVFTEGDALVASGPGLACAVRTADCVPILLGHPRSGRVAAVHAGWRGLVQRVIANAVSKLAPTDPQACVAAIGPHISVSAFEVSSDVAEQLRLACPGANPVVPHNSAKPHVDLRMVAERQLIAAGLHSSHIDHVVGCTYGDASRFFSYRRDGKQSGRHLSAIVAR